MPNIRVRDGSSIYVRIVGRGQPLILLHGFGMNSRHWLPSIWPLRREFRFIMPDLRGFGRSAQQSHSQDCVLSNYADDLHDILNALQLRSVNLAGISMGAFTSLQYFRHYGTERVHRYLNIDQSPFVKQTADWQHGLFGEQGEWKLAGLARLHQKALAFDPLTPFEELPGAFQTAFHQELGDFIAYALANPAQKRLIKRACRTAGLAQAILPGAHWAAYVRCLGAYLHQDYDMRPLAAHLDIPVHVLAGMRSDMYPWEGQHWLAENCPYGEFLPFHRSGHLPMLDEPLRFVQTLRQVFLAENKKPRLFFGRGFSWAS